MVFKKKKGKKYKTFSAVEVAAAILENIRKYFEKIKLELFRFTAKFSLYAVC